VADNNSFDVLVVGSGAAGGMMAYQLTQSGLRVLMLEAGRSYDPRTETPMFSLPQDAPLRAEGTPDKLIGYYDACIGGYELPGEPYTVAEGTGFTWWRARNLGGRTIHWGRQTPRYGPDDLKPFSYSGSQIDWPLSYEELAPFYDRVESLIGVFGPDESEAVFNSPVSPNSIRLQPPAPRVTEMLLAKACREIGLKTYAHPTATLTRDHGDRQACLYATDCIRGCSIGAAFDSITGFLTPALKTGRLQIITNAVVTRVHASAQTGLATGVRYVDKETGAWQDVQAPTVVLAASAMESCRILLNSETEFAPDGLANSSGLVGRAISDTPHTQLKLQVPALENLPPYNEDGISQPHIYVPWQFHRMATNRDGIDFWGGYKIDVAPGSGRDQFPRLSTLEAIQMLNSDLYGQALKEHMRRYYGSIITIRAMGCMSVNEDCRVVLDPDVRDKWGVPVLNFQWTWSDDDFRRMKHANTLLHRIAKQMNAIVIKDDFVESRAAGKFLQSGGGYNHEIGGCRMGTSSATSVLNSSCRSWDVGNLYVVDGAAFVTHAEKNPTLTIMALSMRAADDIIRQKSGASS